MEARPVVLVVEDDAEMNDLERELLELNGLKAIPAYNGVQAIEVFTKTRPDAILLDIMLPEMDGFETCRRIRSANHGRVGIVIISALDSEDCRRTGYEAGADAYFTKPFDPDEIVSAIRRLIKKPETSRL
jgi:DNA-binding response OmpR family regulator